MRTKNSIKNVIIAMFMSIITMFIGFVSQKVFVTNLGTEYLGLNGLYSNILSILSVAEMGFGTAVIYNLYEPLAKNDKKIIKGLMNFYKRIYRIISFIIILLGIIILPFLNTIVGPTNIPNIHILFVLSLIEVATSYLLTYKRSILYADQKNYIVNLVHIGYIIFLNTMQMAFLIITKNYIIYLLLKLIFRILENIIITLIANKRYPYIKEKNNYEIDEKTKKSIYNKVKGLIFHNISGALVQGTDNIIISKMFGVIIVGLYSNYYLIINCINRLLTQLFQSLTASIGNLLLEKDKNKSYSIYKCMLYINSFLYCITSISLICIVNDFITIWLDKNYIISFEIVIIIIINYYIQGLRKTNSVFKNAAGIFYEDRYIAIVEAILNIIFSIIFGKLFGLIGIFLGTITSSIILFVYSYPILVYEKIFKRKYYQFFVDLFKHVIISIFICLITYYLTKNIIATNYLLIIVKGILVTIISSMLYFIITIKSKEFKYIKNILIKGVIGNEK